MSVLARDRGAVDPAPSAVAPLGVVYRLEVAKLAAQWRFRLLLLACLVAPAVYTAVVSRQSSLPADALYGRWMGQSGWAGSLAVLVFLGTLVLPLLTALVAGDVFSAEDRLGTWRHLLVAVRSPRVVFAAKALAALSVVLVLVAALAASSLVGGLVSVGSHPVPGLDGHLLGSTDLARTVLLAWACVLPPTLAFAAVGLLGSVALGRSPLGLLLPVVVALVLQGVALLPVPVAVRLALPVSAFTGWRGLLTEDGQPGPLWVTLLVSLAWAVVATWAAARIFVRRDFTDLAHDGSGRTLLLTGLAPLLALSVLVTAVLAVGAGATGSGVDRAKVEAGLATSFSHLYVLQTDQLHRPAVTEDDLRATASCDKGGDRVVDEGPGSDWRCVVTWTLPGSSATGSATYQLDVLADGKYVADGDGPQEVNGWFQVRTPAGDAPNPLWQLDGSLDLLAQADPDPPHPYP